MVILPLPLHAEGGRMKLTSVLWGYAAGATSVFTYMNYFQKRSEYARRISPEEAQDQRIRAQRVDRFFSRFISSS